MHGGTKHAQNTIDLTPIPLLYLIILRAPSRRIRNEANPAAPPLVPMSTQGRKDDKPYRFALVIFQAPSPIGLAT